VSERRGRAAAFDDAGGGTVAAVGLVAAVVMTLGLVAPIVGVSVARHRAAAIADAAALAAAASAAGLVAGEPCTVAAHVVALGGGDLRSCEIDGLVATVAVSIPMIGGAVAVYSTAGPPAAVDHGAGTPIRPGISPGVGRADMV